MRRVYLPADAIVQAVATAPTAPAARRNAGFRSALTGRTRHTREKARSVSNSLPAAVEAE